MSGSDYINALLSTLRDDLNEIAGLTTLVSLVDYDKDELIEKLHVARIRAYESINRIDDFREGQAGYDI